MTGHLFLPCSLFDSRQWDPNVSDGPRRLLQESGAAKGELLILDDDDSDDDSPTTSARSSADLAHLEVKL
jgi:hypothetical protein